MKKILFPFEINRNCYREAYVYAAKLARNLGAELIMLHTFSIGADKLLNYIRGSDIQLQVSHHSPFWIHTG